PGAVEGPAGDLGELGRHELPRAGSPVHPAELAIVAEPREAGVGLPKDQLDLGDSLVEGPPGGLVLWFGRDEPDVHAHRVEDVTTKRSSDVGPQLGLRQHPEHLVVAVEDPPPPLTVPPPT